MTQDLNYKPKNIILTEKVSKYEQEIPQSHTADKHTAP